MKILLDDQAARIRIVENPELGYYELRLDQEIAGTLDYRDVDDRRVFGLTEIRSDLRGRGLATLLIRTVFDDLDTRGAQVTNYCPAIDRYLRKHPEHRRLIDSVQPGMSDRNALARAGTSDSRLDAALRSEHARLHDLAAVPRSNLSAPHHRRHGADMFTAYAAQHLAASAEVLLHQARNWPSDEVSGYLGNLRRLEQSLRVLKGRQYGDKRYLDLGHDEVWAVIDRLLAEHEQLESMVAVRIAADSDRDALAVLAEDLLTSQDNSPTRTHPNSPHVGVPGRIARRMWRFADSTADDLEGRVVPARYRRHPKHDSAFSHYLRGSQIDDEAADERL
ncbi:putative GNAT family acetyltransferase [Kribbella voronezhensis]|uniref:Putative GNAT family acetyltransferase n=1 Tax=Kribbella voronezhensis TaxID=2512212 RepID=A0A4R7SXU3_9ACTN|nr:GNAT family N-acetyltransferase [Kribbella voronezhensis]TDU83297.1 putative GNAT family acetyltransferase [Kribbella voronezhensis]